MDYPVYFIINQHIEVVIEGGAKTSSASLDGGQEIIEAKCSIDE